MEPLEQTYEKCCQVGHESHLGGTWKCSEFAKVSHFLLGFLNLTLLKGHYKPALVHPLVAGMWKIPVIGESV